MKQKKAFILILLIVSVLLVFVIIYGINKNSNSNYNGNVNSLVENSNTTYLNISELNVNNNIEATYIGSMVAVPELINVKLPSEFSPIFEGHQNPHIWYTEGEKNFTSVVQCSFGLTTGSYEVEEGIVGEADEGTIDEQLYRVGKYFGVNKVNINIINGIKWYTIVVDNYKDEENVNEVKKGYYNYTEKNGNVFLLSYEILNDVGNKEMNKAIEYHNDILTTIRFQ